MYLLPPINKAISMQIKLLVCLCMFVIAECVCVVLYLRVCTHVCAHECVCVYSFVGVCVVWKLCHHQICVWFADFLCGNFVFVFCVCL